MFVRSIRLTYLFASLSLFSSAAVAQTKDASKPTPSVAAPPSSTPERTTASFGDWVVRCETPPQQKRICEVAEIITLQGQTGPIAQVAFGRAAPGEPMRLTVVLPTNITFATKPQMAAAKAGGPTSDLMWQNCTAVGCFASTDIEDETVAAFGAQSEPGRLTFKDAASREIALPLSFKGLAQAIAALAKDN